MKRKKIPPTRLELAGGFTAFLSPCDLPCVLAMCACWHVHPMDQTYYARGKVDGKDRYLHDLVLSFTDGHKKFRSEGLLIDHIDGRGYNCARDNLRWVTPRQNAYNTHVCEWNGVRRGMLAWQYWNAEYACWVGSYPTAFHAACQFDWSLRACTGQEWVEMPWGIVEGPFQSFLNFPHAGVLPDDLVLKELRPLPT